VDGDDREHVATAGRGCRLGKGGGRIARSKVASTVKVAPFHNPELVFSGLMLLLSVAF
jgi:hypothetical protein